MINNKLNFKINLFTCTFICFSPWSSIIFICSSNALPRVKHENLACSITLFWAGGNISLPIRYSYLSILPDDEADIFAASLLISYCSFSYLISLSIIITFYILSKRVFLKREGLWIMEYSKYMEFCKDSWIVSSKYLVNDEIRFIEPLICWNFHNKIIHRI